MRICSIVNSLTTGGAEVLVTGLSAEFARQGDHPLVIALCDASTVGNSLETELRMAQEIVSAGGEFRSLGLSASRNPFVGAKRLKEVLLEFAPDITHAHTVRALPMLALARAQAPVLLTHHNTRLPFPPWMFKLCDLMTQGYVAIGADVEKILRRHASKPITRISNAASRQFKAGAPRTLSLDRKTILCVGAISEQKNYALLIEVAAALKSSGIVDPLPRFRIAGAGSDLPALTAKAAKLGLDGIVDFLGERSDVPDLMQDSDLYLNVSLYEGMPLTLLEAMASGLPIVATDVPGNRELIEDGSNGIKAPLGDADAIARAISEILGNADLYSTLSAGSIEKSGEFSIDRAAVKHRDLYASNIAMRKRSRHPPNEVAERELNTPQ
ncbi:MAG: glycosyltransferase [Pseudomonadota bacterium]